MDESSLLFSQGRIGNLTTKNRIVMAPMVLGYANEDGTVTPKYLAHMERVASGGVGIMTLEASYVREDGRGFPKELGIHSDDVIPGLEQVVKIAHRYGALVGPQIFHAGRQTTSAVTGMPIIAPSAVPDPTNDEVPQAMSRGEIREMIHAYANSARRAKAAGCDFVEIHGAHGYLIMQFLSPISNLRGDEYGGSLENRMRFLLEIISAVRAATEDTLPVIVRLSGDEMVPGGLASSEALQIARISSLTGISALSISAGSYASFDKGYMIPPMSQPDGLLVPLAEEVKKVVDIPVIAVGKIRSPEHADQILLDGKADFIALARSLLADPDWPRKAQNGLREPINHCIACNQGCIGRLFSQQDVWCTVNPETSREEDFQLPPPAKKRRILVAGGGPAGMEAAIYATRRGHSVLICEKSDHLGGQLIPASVPPFRQGWSELLRYLTTEVERLGIEVRLKTSMTPNLAKHEDADVAIVAVGASPAHPKIPGLEHANVVTAIDLLEGTVQTRGNVLVAGGGCSGAQTAEYLACKGHDVTIVEMLGGIALDAAPADRELLLKRLAAHGIKMLTNTRLSAIDEDTLLVESPSGKQEIRADTLVLCTGMVSNDDLAAELEKVVPKVITVGDAVQPRKVTEAIAEAAIATLTL